MFKPTPRWIRFRRLLRVRERQVGIANLAQGRADGADRVLSYLNGWHSFSGERGIMAIRNLPYPGFSVRIVEYTRGYDDARAGRLPDPIQCVR